MRGLFFSGTVIFVVMWFAMIQALRPSVKNVSSSIVQRRREMMQRNLFSLFGGKNEPTNVPIIDAVLSKNKDTIVATLARSSINEKDPTTGNNAMHFISKKGHYQFPPADIPTLLIDRGIDINATNGENKTALEISLLSGWQKIAMLLLDRGADRSVVTESVKSKITCPDCKRVVKTYSL